MKFHRTDPSRKLALTAYVSTTAVVFLDDLMAVTTDTGFGVASLFFVHQFWSRPDVNFVTVFTWDAVHSMGDVTWLTLIFRMDQLTAYHCTIRKQMH